MTRISPFTLCFMWSLCKIGLKYGIINNIQCSLYFLLICLPSTTTYQVYSWVKAAKRVLTGIIHGTYLHHINKHLTVNWTGPCDPGCLYWTSIEISSTFSWNANCYILVQICYFKQQWFWYRLYYIENLDRHSVQFACPVLMCNH